MAVTRCCKRCATSCLPLASTALIGAKRWLVLRPRISAAPMRGKYTVPNNEALSLGDLHSNVCCWHAILGQWSRTCMRPQFQPELPFLLLLDQSLYQQLFGFVSFATCFGKTDHRPNTESKPILFLSLGRRYFIRQYLEPFVVTSRYKPPPSAIL